MISQKEHIILHLSLISGVGPSSVQKILQQLDDLTFVYKFSVQDFMRICGISEKKAQIVIGGLKNTTILNHELSLIKKHCVKITAIVSDDYPELLKHITVPPAILYYHGKSLNTFNLCCAVVGSRRSNSYGKKVIQQLLPSLVAHNVTIVSGGAIGIDTLAHQETLDAQGKTIAVLGSGLLRAYPARNKTLFNQIVQQGGAVVSSFPLTMEAHPGNFPARNRIIAGLSSGCIVAQAAQKSGARITANFALNQGRTVFAVPGVIDDPVSVGCHELIREGATLISSVRDVLVDLGVAVDDHEQCNQELPLKQVVKKKEKTNEPQTFEEKIIYECKRPKSLDELLMIDNIALADLQTLLFDLQLTGILQQNFAGKWQQVV
jgi:DNA processing protein